MGEMTVVQIVTVAVPVVGALSWLLNLSGRLNTHDALHEAHRKAHAELRDDISYIRERIDRALNGRD